MAIDIIQFDISDRANEGSWMDIIDPIKGTPAGARLKVVSSDSAIYDRVAAEIQRRRTDRWKAQGGMPDLGVDYEEMQHNLVEICVACTLDWEGIEENGVPLPCNDGNKRAVFTKLRWLRRQVDVFMGKVSNFLSEAPTTSPGRSTSSSRSMKKSVEALAEPT